MGMICENVTLVGGKFSFTVPMLAGTYTGMVATDRSTLIGTWKQDTAVTLNFKRESAALSMPPYPPPKYDAAIAPVPLTQMHDLLSRELGAQLENGILAPTTGVGIAIGIVEHGRREIYTYGTAKSDSIFEIGSVTKTFTGLALAQMVQQKKVRFDEPVRHLLPPGTVTKPASSEITLLDLAIHRSGLPSLPDNFKPSDITNLFADYHDRDLYAYMNKHGVAKPAAPAMTYSNLGFGLLGQALSNRAGTGYAQLIQAEVTGPLGLSDTVITLSPEQQQRFIVGYESPSHPTHHWDLEALAGAGALRSTVADLLTYVEAYLHPDKLSAVARSTPDGRTLPTALRSSLQLRDEEVKPGMSQALAWGYKRDGANYFHDGGTGGFTSCVIFSPKRDDGVVVLMNVEADYGMLAENLCWHVSQRIAGKPALSLNQ